MGSSQARVLRGWFESTPVYMFRPGDIIVVSGPTNDHPERKPGWITVRENFGPIQGHGWLILSKEGNLLLVKDLESYIASVIFVTHKAHASALMWLVNHPERLNDLAGFIEYCKKSNAIKSHIQFDWKAWYGSNPAD